MHVKFGLLPVEGRSKLESVVSMQSTAQEVTMLFKLIATAKDSWACFYIKRTWTNSNYTRSLQLIAVFLVPHKEGNIISKPNVGTYSPNMGE